VAMRTNSVSP